VLAGRKQRQQVLIENRLYAIGKFAEATISDVEIGTLHNNTDLPPAMRQSAVDPTSISEATIGQRKSRSVRVAPSCEPMITR